MKSVTLGFGIRLRFGKLLRVESGIRPLFKIASCASEPAKLATCTDPYFDEMAQYDSVVTRNRALQNFSQSSQGDKISSSLPILGEASWNWAPLQTVLLTGITTGSSRQSCRNAFRRKCIFIIEWLITFLRRPILLGALCLS